MTKLLSRPGSIGFGARKQQFAVRAVQLGIQPAGFSAARESTSSSIARASSSRPDNDARMRGSYERHNCRDDNTRSALTEANGRKTCSGGGNIGECLVSPMYARHADARINRAYRVVVDQLNGTVAATLCREDLQEAQYKNSTLDIATAVSQRLGNTPTVALQSYIPPEVFAEWRAHAGV
jgi:hypothetical protein